MSGQPIYLLNRSRPLPPPWRYRDTQGSGYRGKGGMKFVRYRPNLSRIQRVLSRVQPEIKTYTATVSATTITSSGGVQHVSAVLQGDDYTERVGRRIFCLSVQLRLVLRPDADLVSTGAHWKGALIMDHANTGTAPSVADIYANQEIEDLRNAAPHNLKRFTTLYEGVEYVGINAATGAPALVFVNVYRKVNKKIWFSGTAQTDEGQNSIWLYQTSSEATDGPISDGFCRIRFIDM